ncbi:SAP domain containing protein [Parasponia andersonii]|uniref:SAP domain containing protein n=1 Tax=Parasponia andersonii TaxID=3476 RepID=A0A2P5B5A1_PARAD|nr:SAP domain containing protein [Parasponia andersonii]
MAQRKGKRPYDSLSSSSPSSSSDEEDEADQADTTDGDGGDDDYDEEEWEDSDQDEADDSGDADDESLCNKVIRLLKLKEHDELDSLKLKDCKAYLRKYGLRVAGTKSVCLQRIKEHWRLKDGNGEVLYPSSSFVINCTGDVCKGDVVLFTQKVYERFDKVTKHGKVLGKRTVAGRVVKESYGAAKQQHTFTVRLLIKVEVLWSKGIKKLTLLYPLLVKGRNLYKMRTFRQRWSNEAVRLNVLAEKHKRGAVARLERMMNKKRKLPADRGMKGRKKIASAGLSQKRKTCETKRKRDYIDRRAETSLRESRIYNDRQYQDSTVRSSEHFKEYQKFARPNTGKVPSFQSHRDPPRIHHQSQISSQYMSAPYPAFRHDRSSDPTIMRLPLRTSADIFVMPAPQLQRFDHTTHTNHASVNPLDNFELRNWSGFQGPDIRRPLHPFFSRN